MNFKKKITSIFAGIFLLIGAAYSIQNTVKADDNAHEIVERANNYKTRSYRIRQKVSGFHNSFIQNMTVGGRPIVTRVTQRNKHNNLTIWQNGHYEYIKYGKHWYKIKASIPNSKVKSIAQNWKDDNSIFNFNKSIIDNATVKTVNGKYIVTVKNSQQTNDMITQATLDAFKALGLSKSDFSKISKELILTHFSFVETVDQKNYRPIKIVSHATMKVDGKNVKVYQVMDQIGKHSHLKIPKSVIKHAKKMKF